MHVALLGGGRSGHDLALAIVTGSAAAAAVTRLLVVVVVVVYALAVAPDVVTDWPVPPEVLWLEPGRDDAPGEVCGRLEREGRGR